MENALLAAESLGVSSIIVGSPWPHQNKLCKKLKLPKEVWPLFLICLGYTKKKPFKKPRLPLKAVLAKNAYNKKLPLNKLKHYYNETNKKLKQANYFKKSTANLPKHWEYKFGKQSEEKIWSKLKKNLDKCYK